MPAAHPHICSKRPSPRLLLVLLLLALPAASHAEWIEDGVEVAAEYQQQIYHEMIPDGSGGAFFAWSDDRNTDPNVFDIYAQRIDAYGNPMWQEGGVVVCEAIVLQSSAVLVADGSGGVIIAWEDNRDSTTTLLNIYAQRLDASGTPQWTADGVGICTASGYQSNPRIVSDLAGGAIIAWTDGRTDLSGDIYAQRVNSAGVAQWTPNGVAVCAVAASLVAQMEAVSDGSGGILMTWYDGRYPDYDVFVHRISGSGAPVAGWSTNGRDVSNVIATDEFNPEIVADGAGGAYLVWEDSRGSGRDLYLQHISPTGVYSWFQGRPITVANDDQKDQRIIRDAASGDLIVVWEDLRDLATTSSDIYAQRLDTNANPKWLYNGTPIVTASQVQADVQVVSDGEGGAYFTWWDYRTFDHVIYASRIDAGGFLLWGSSGVVVCDQPGAMFRPRIIQHSLGGALVSWEDYRTALPDIRALRVEPREGFWGMPEPEITSVADIPGDQGGFVRVSWNRSDRDRVPYTTITHYSVWRATDAVSAMAATERANLDGALDLEIDDSGIRLVPLEEMESGFEGPAFRPAASGDFFWEYVGEQEALYFPGYSFAAPTEADSAGGNAALHYFQVVAHTYTQYQSFPSMPDSGYSLDNLATGAPIMLTAVRAGGSNVDLDWGVGEATEPDFSHFAIYRSQVPGVTLDPLNFIGSTPDTFSVDTGADPALEYYYIVVAVDIHGNTSDPTNEAMVSGTSTGISGLPALTTLRVRTNIPNPFSGSTELFFGLPSASEVKIEIFDISGRRVHSAELEKLPRGWHRVPFRGRGGDGRVLPSGVYFYRVTAGDMVETKKMVIKR